MMKEDVYKRQGLCFALAVHAQKSDSIKSVSLSEVVVTESYQQHQMKKTALTVDVANKDFLRKNFTGNLIQAMANIPGVQAMDIGVGTSKPMIRGMGFNRIVVLENGVKQEGQQWGADHGLELDAFNVDAVNVLKGPSSCLLYTSPAHYHTPDPPDKLPDSYLHEPKYELYHNRNVFLPKQKRYYSDDK